MGRRAKSYGPDTDGAQANINRPGHIFAFSVNRLADILDHGMETLDGVSWLRHVSLAIDNDSGRLKRKSQRTSAESLISGLTPRVVRYISK